MAHFYRYMRRYVNFFQPSFKLMEKTPDGARVTKLYHSPLTMFQRVQAHPAVAQEAKDVLAAQFGQFDPVALLHAIPQRQARLAALADAAPFAESAHGPKADVDAFLGALRHAWKEGEVRPTSLKKRPSPEGAAALTLWPRSPTASRRGTTRIRHKPSAISWTGFRRLIRDDYPEALIRTVQRRVKIWRGDIARSLVFGPDEDAQPQMTEPETEKGEDLRQQMPEATV